MAGKVSLDGSVGVADLLGLSGSTPTGTYVLIDTTAASFSLLPGGTLACVWGRGGVEWADGSILSFGA